VSSAPVEFHLLNCPAVVPFSIHLSATAHGRKQSVVVPLATRALAVARTRCDVIPRSRPKNVGSATLPLEPSRYTFTRTHLPAKLGGQSKNTSTPEEAPVCDGQTGFAKGAAVGQPAELDAHSAVSFALLNGLVVVGGSVTSSE
jgi:hypothetical protein